MEFQSIILFKRIFIIYKNKYYVEILKVHHCRVDFHSRVAIFYSHLIQIFYTSLIQTLYKSYTNTPLGFQKKLHNVSFSKLESPGWSERNLIHSWKFLHFCFRRRPLDSLFTQKQLQWRLMILLLRCQDFFSHLGGNKDKTCQECSENGHKMIKTND